MKLYNSMTQKKEEFTPIQPGKVKIYACGPTVYNLIHVGNARMVIIFDVLRRYFEFKGMEVTFVQNFTDIDDKIICRAGEEGLTATEIAEKYTAEYFTDAAGLGVRKATHHPKATETIPEIVAMIAVLIDKGCAYVSGGDVYYRTERFADYGKLSRQPLEDLLAGARINVSEVKESPMDFALWKSAKPGEPFWESPWGRGRPGWHIECSAMSKKFLGDTIDIHCGGKDLIFPHHENEIAQSEAANGRRFVNYWLHNGFISIDNRKMSKSFNNFFTVREAAAAYGYETIRMFIVSAQYRSPLNYSEEALMHAKAALLRLRTAADSLKFLTENGVPGGPTEEERKKLECLKIHRECFIRAMEDDLNTADALAAIFEMVREINTFTAAGTDPSRGMAKACREALTELTDVLGLLCGETEENLDAEIERLIEARQAARKRKDFREADRIRDKLRDMCIALEDTPQGVKWKRIEQ